MKNELRAYSPEGYKTFFPINADIFKRFIAQSEHINNSVLREALLQASDGGINEYGEKEHGVFKIEWMLLD